MKKVFIATSVLFLTTGCADDAVLDGSMLGEARGELWGNWGPADWSPHLLGVSMSPFPPCSEDFCFPPPRKSYAWFLDAQTGDSWLCKGSSTAEFCNLGLSEFFSPRSPRDIVAMGIAHDTSHVYTWYMPSSAYLNGSYSQGTSDHLTKYHAQRAFTPAINPNTGDYFLMSQLIEVDNGDNLHWYYYWKDGSTVFRSRGKSFNAESHDGPREVKVSSQDGAIVGILFDDHYNPDRIVTYYENGWRNVSTDSLNLKQ
jgi:hypothetical protein